METNRENRKKIAIVGAGISGLTAAYVLNQTHNVDIYEKNDYLGGHTNTREVLDSQQLIVPVDTGFIVCNAKNYPNFYKLLDKLGVKLRDSNMSFGFYCEETRLNYVGPDLREFLGNPNNLLDLKFLKMLFEKYRFNKKVLSDLKLNKLNAKSMGEYLAEFAASKYFTENYLNPLLASIWSSSENDLKLFPAQTFATFFRNHGMLEFGTRPKWQTVVGGSYSYIKAIREKFSGNVFLNSKIDKVIRSIDGINIKVDGEDKRYDRVILATHANEALDLLGDPSHEETSYLNSWRYSQNRTVLHKDSSILPVNKKMWASWNYFKKDSKDKLKVAITYYMNKLQGFKASDDFFVTLNPDHNLDANKIIYEVNYTHPIYDNLAISAQDKLKALNGQRNTYFCGAHFGYGFHEDGVKSALDVCSHFGLGLEQ